MKNLNQSFRKRAIYSSLQPHLKLYDLMDAMVLWESEYADAPAYSLRSYLAALEKRLNKAINNKMLLLDIVANMNKDSRELLPDPSNAVGVYKTQTQSDELHSYASSELAAFQLFISKWLILAGEPTRSEIIKVIREKVYDLNISRQLRSQLDLWLVKPEKGMLVMGVDVGDLRAITSCIYSAFCLHIGPSATDKLMAEAIHKIRNNGGAAYSHIYAKFL